MANLDVGSIVCADLTIGKHPAIVLSSQDEIAASGEVFVVAISANWTISNPEDLVQVPPGLGLKKKCFVQCGVREKLPLKKVESRNRKAWGPFLEKVVKQVQIATERDKK